MPAFLQDLRYAFRTLRKSTLFTAVAVLSLALGIGANTAIFTLVNQLLLQRLPVKNPDQLVMLTGEGRHYGSNNGPGRLSYLMYADIRDRNQVFSGMFCTYYTTFSVTNGSKTELVSGEHVSGNYFRTLGVGAAVGRLITAQDDLRQGEHPVAVLSYGYWKARFGSDPSVVGRKIVVNGFPLTIIGVSQAGFDGVQPGFAPEIRVPITMHDVMPKNTNGGELNNRRRRFLIVFARLKPGVGMAQAKASLQPLFHQIIDMEVQMPAFSKTSDFTRQQFLRMWMDVKPGARGRSYLRDQFSKPLTALMAIVGLVLLIACSNLANLLIARASARQKEIAVRLAIGSSRWRLVRQLMVESMALAAVGGALGIELAILMDKALLRFLPTGTTPLSISSDPNWPMLGFTALVALVAGAFFGLVPALQSTRPELAGTLKDQAGSVIQGSVMLRKGLVVAQVTLSLVLLIGAGLFVQSLKNLKELNPGFDTKNLLQFSVEPTLATYQPDRTRAYYRRLQERLDATPGVESSALAVIPLLEDNEWDNSMTVEGYVPKQGEMVDPHMQFCSPDFFKTMRIPVLLGRDFTSGDLLTAPKVAIVNKKFVDRYFAGKDPLGRHIGMGSNPGTKTDITIVGVAADTKYENMREPVPEEVYVPDQQTGYVNGMTAYVRPKGDPTSVFNVLRRVVADVDGDVPMYDLRTMDDQMEISLSTDRLLAALSSAFGLVATLLAAMGLYGVMAFMVSRRTREIGVRMALGANSGSVVWMVMREVLALAAVGVGIGLPVAWFLAQLVKSQLFGVQPADVLTMGAAAFGIATVAGLAGFLPARRATGIDPTVALRWE